MGRRTLLAILTLLSAATAAAAQSGGTVTGRVSAPDGRPLPGIQITISAMAPTRAMRGVFRLMSSICRQFLIGLARLAGGSSRESVSTLT